MSTEKKLADALDIHIAMEDKLRRTNAALVTALSEVLAHVEDESAKRVGNQCTLCKTYRDKIRAALALAEGKDAK